MRRTILTVAVVLGAAIPAAAENEVVYWPLVTDGAEYRRVPYPAEAGDMVLLADRPAVIEARQAEVAFWPITREYLAAVNRSSPPVDAVTEIVDSDGTVMRPAAEPYVMWHPDGVGAGPAELVTGPRAAEVYETFVTNGRAAAEALREHQRVVAQHHAAVEAWLKIAASRPADLPPPPPEFDLPEPEPYTAFATPPEVAPVVTLPPGRYTLRLVDGAGSVIPGSERRLNAIAPLGEGIGYIVRPADRWTQPVVSFSPDETIYTTGRADLYLQPVRVVEYSARDYGRLFRPQSHEASDPWLTLWVPASGAAANTDTGRLAVFDGQDRVSTLDTVGFRVVQRSGAGYGYDIAPFEPAPGAALEPDFYAMRIQAGTPHSRIAMESDTPLPPGERDLRLSQPPQAGLLFLAALLPLVIGFGMRVMRRRPRAVARPAAAG